MADDSIVSHQIARGQTAVLPRPNGIEEASLSM